MLFPFIRVIGQVVADKQTRVLQSMLAMGLRARWYVLATFVFSGVKSCFTVLIVSLMVKATVFSHVGFWMIFWCLFLSVLCYIGLGFLVSCFFTDSNNAVITGMILFCLLNVGIPILQAIQSNQALVIFLLLASPSTAVEILKNAFLHAQANLASADRLTLGTRSFNIPLSSAFIAMAIQAVVYVILGVLCFRSGTD